MKVLIGDDDDITRLLPGSALTKVGHKVHAVANGREASHELRTPMNHILGFGQLREMNPLNPEQKDSVGQILTNGAHLMTLIDRILATSESRPEDLRFLKTSATLVGRDRNRTVVR